ncbi:MAG: hypothetical protein KKH93_03355 [Candidatus Omnitrophica bacterium]|nr:hypothetical protein [Candidatus Omnitrophota bacterium]MBU2043718.1 hypothetical protein [Candidatus Omnitrophota bacterium]MBU2266226.1 hypothetical protein [Candidatus Omnitrophota bacterium]MBU2474028.1 hypothetical protein [Candidatus Omnitrophota bacterium]
MRKSLLLIFLLFILPLPYSYALFKPVGDLESSQIKRAVISPFTPSLIYVASKNSLYQSQDSGQTFSKLSVFKDEEVQHLFFDPYLANLTYIVTSRHLYRWDGKLEELFTAQDEERIYTACRHQDKLYIGTSQGFYLALEDTLVWRKPKNLSDASVYWIEGKADDLYLATDKGVYLLKGVDNLKRLFLMRQDQEEDSQALIAQVIKADLFDKNRLWMGTSRGLYKSLDLGKNWQKVYIGGLGNLLINCITQTRLQDDSLYLGTTKGFFKVNFKKNSLEQIFEGLSSSYIFWADFTPEGKIYLSTAKGLYSADYFTAASQLKGLEISTAKEPSINEIQQIVLKYNEVHPDKIKQWSNALKYRALFPEISLDYDKTVTTALGASYDRVQVGPQDWGINLKWDVGDLIWNSYEDDVDTRARLNTQLRLDILDEINRVYFERLRLKREIAESALPEEELFLKKLRLEELTAMIDGYSGGYFSKRVKELNEQ